jgi:hypothetical protein
LSCPSWTPRTQIVRCPRTGATSRADSLRDCGIAGRSAHLGLRRHHPRPLCHPRHNPPPPQSQSRP